MTNQNNIHIIATGGTIDSHWDGTKDTTVPLRHSAIPEFLKILKLYEKIEFTEACMKDSRDLTTADRKKILDIVKKSRAKRIIITHGTYTLPDTARYLQANLKQAKQTIILTCSMIPLAGFIPTDAGFNIGYALAKSQELPPGIYACVNGRIFAPEEIVKILSEGRFDSVFTI